MEVLLELINITIIAVEMQYWSKLEAIYLDNFLPLLQTKVSKDSILKFEIHYPPREIAAYRKYI